MGIELSAIEIVYPCCGLEHKEKYEEYGGQAEAVMDRVADDHKEVCDSDETPFIEIIGRYFVKGY